MTFTITISGTDIRFPAATDTTILDAAQSAGWEFPYSCRKGACDSCRGTLRSGVSTETPDRENTLLFCQARPLSDMEISPKAYRQIDPNSRKVVDAKLFRMDRMADDVLRLHLRFPAGKRIRFKAGQYLDVLLPGSERRSFSMANSPRRNDGVELHVRLLPGGLFSDQICPTLVPGSSLLRLELPFGGFGLREDSDRPIVMVASGTGFSPIQSILHDLFERNLGRDVRLYWGARRRKDLYALDVPQTWAEAHENFRFIPVLSEPDASDGWTGRVGLVHRAVLDDFPTLENHEVYACGVPAMVDAARRDFVQLRGLPADNFFADSFVSSSDTR